MPQLPPVFIVFTKGTFQLLRLGVYSLQAHSNINFCIVCNGMAEEEVAEVDAFCRHFANVDFIDFPSAGRMLPHGSLLQLLFEQTNQEFFSFADSDVFALESFHDDFVAALDSADIVSIADHPVQEGKPQKVGTGGCSTVSPGGLQLANTFFAAYRRDCASRLMLETGVSIERYQRHSQIPEAAKLALPLKDRERGNFDTGKLLCALASRRGHRVVHQPLPQLFHMGRMSVRALGDSEELPQRLRNKRLLREFLGAFLVGLQNGETPAMPEFTDPAVNRLLSVVCPRLGLLHADMEQALDGESVATNTQAHAKQ